MIRDRIRQFAEAGRRPTSSDHALCRGYLDGPLLDLFLAQHPRDIVHGVATARWLLVRGHDDVILLQAALLHDIGKGDQRRLDRVAHVAATRLRLGAVAPQHESRLRIRRALARSRDHSELGAELLVAAGAEARLVELTRLHHSTALGADPVLAFLQVADAAS